MPLRFLLAQLAQPHSTLELICIAAIFRHHSLSSDQLARLTNLSLTSVNRAMSKLIRKSLATRSPHPSGYSYSLTPQAKSFFINFLKSLTKP